MNGLKDILEVLRRRDRQIVRRGLISMVDDSGAVQRLDLKGIFGTIRKGVEHFQPFGFVSGPPNGAEYVQVQPNGDSAHNVVIIAFDRRYRLHVSQGEVALYNQWGDFLKLDKDRNGTLQVAGKATVDAPSAEFTGNVKIDGTLEVDGTCDFKSLVTAEAGMNVTGTLAATVAMNAPACTVTTMTVNGKDIGSHRHTGVTTGAGDTGGMA